MLLFGLPEKWLYPYRSFTQRLLVRLCPSVVAHALVEVLIKRAVEEAPAVTGGGAVLSEQHDEWQVGKRYFGVGSLAKLERKEEMREQPELVAG